MTRGRLIHGKCGHVDSGIDVTLYAESEYVIIFLIGARGDGPFPLFVGFYGVTVVGASLDKTTWGNVNIL